MKLQLLSFFFFIATLSFAQYTHVPDDRFEQALIDLGYDDVLDNQVLTANINKVVTLNVSSKMISNLTGLEGFTSLEELNCLGNNLSNIDLSNNLQLKILNITGNQLNELDITNNIQLTHLEVGVNFLTDLDVSRNKFLESLTCNMNSLTMLDVSHNPLLAYLMCANNKILNVNFSPNSGLKELIVDFNNLLNIDLHNLSNLELFSCFSNQITSLNFEHNPKLKTIICYYNEIEVIDISSNPDVDFLHCSNNSLISLNLKNRNNLENFNFRSKANEHLLCIEIDDINWANNNWTEYIDEWSTFNEDCNYMSTNEQDFTTFQIFPNPTKNTLNFSQELKEFSIYDLSGKLILQGKGNQTNVSNLPTGTYLIKGITTSGKTINQKFIKN